jgi:lipid A disaccharide synthetase
MKTNTCMKLIKSKYFLLANLIWDYEIIDELTYENGNTERKKMLTKGRNILFPSLLNY